VKSCRRKRPQTTHIRDYPERVTITRKHHAFEGQSLEVLRQANMQGSLRFVLILPDGSKSLVPAEWTDFGSNRPSSASTNDLTGCFEDLLRLRSLTDALLQRASTPPVMQSAPAQESHVATESGFYRHPRPTGVSMGESQQRTEATHHREVGSTDAQRSHSSKRHGGAGQ